ncbi:MAG: prepilin-type N-terminal cleavage/methylation domain-containing protein [Proteobacteria bacterium]|nr:prepilin-type N-terminal cleavage/methylation domain-containing protein [Pseudomonadota bacterium]NIS72290.1 prepilin-type N-terminal cleavage/methylation domain-containing protein [Pseudomonadota bacterium]
MKNKRFEKGLTIIELLIVVNIVAILIGAGTIIASEYGSESRCMEIYSVLPQIIHSQAFHYMKNNAYYAADHNELRNYGVDLSETRYFTYSTIPNGLGLFSVRADATEWAAGGWALYDHRGDPRWSSDGVLIQRHWLTE